MRHRNSPATRSLPKDRASSISVFWRLGINRLVSLFGGEGEPNRRDEVAFHNVRDLISHIERAESAVAEVRARLPSLVASVSKQSSASNKVGPSKNIAVWRLSILLANVLRGAGLRVSKTRDGLDGSILAILHPQTRDVHRPTQLSYRVIADGVDYSRKHHPKIPGDCYDLLRSHVIQNNKPDCVTRYLASVSR